MDHAERDELSEWIKKSATLLEPPAGWEPNPQAAGARFRSRDNRQFSLRRLLQFGIAIVGITCILAAAVPLTRVLAQQAGVSWYKVDQFWYWISIGRNLQLVRVGKLPNSIRSLASQVVVVPDPPQVVPDIAEAARRAGFSPRMPNSGVLPGKPAFSVRAPASVAGVFRTAELELALQHAGVTNQSVPAAWDGTRIGVQLRAAINAEWSDVPGDDPATVHWTHMTLTQSTSPVFTLPPGIDLTSFAALNLRGTLMSQDTSRRFAQEAVPASALLVGSGTRTGIDRSDAVAARYVSLRHGPGVLLEEWHHQDISNIRRLILLWSAPGRVYALNGELNAPLQLNSYALAGAVATVVNVANTIE